MDSISTSIAETIKKRTTSVALGTYIFFWVTYHWQGVYVTFFISEEKIFEKFGLLKNEYVDKYFFGYDGSSGVDLRFFVGYLLPLLMTYLFIWILPQYVLIHAYRREQMHKNHRRRVKYEEEIKIKDLEREAALQKSETIDAEIQLSEKKVEAGKKDPKILWKEEFKALSSKPREYKQFKYILDSMYAYSGKIKVLEKKAFAVPGENDMEEIFSIPPAALKMADVRGLIKINTNETITLTEKGKYFAELYKY